MDLNEEEGSFFKVEDDLKDDFFEKNSINTINE